MIQIIGKYHQERSENLEEYFSTLGVPYIPRKMMVKSNPRLEITKNGDEWTLKSITMMRTQSCVFTLDREYEETMPFGVTLRNITSMEGNSLTTISIAEDGTKVTRRYDFTEDGVVLVMCHERSSLVAKRYYKRIE